jgi:hypothetical protein
MTKRGELMKRLAGSLLLVSAFALLPGCSGTFQTQYAPASAIRGSSRLVIGDVTYESAKLGRAKPNQIENTAVGAVYIDSTVEEYVRRAYVQEIERSGFRRGPDAMKLGVTVHRLLADDVGYTVIWTLDETFVLNASDGKELVRKRITTTEKTGKMVSKARLVGALNGIVTRAYERFFDEPDVASLRD